jgi:hypothetical protein
MTISVFSLLGERLFEVGGEIPVSAGFLRGKLLTARRYLLVLGGF